MTDRRLLCFLFFVLLLAGFVSLCLGSTSLDLSEIARGLIGAENPRLVMVMQEIRLPRALLGMIVGASLGLSGAVLQGLLQNPLAEPGLTGASASAGLGAVVALYFGWAAAFPPFLPIAAMLSAAMGTILLFFVAGQGAGTLTLILAGIALSSLATALTSLAMNLSPNPYAISEMVLWLLGSLRDRSFDDIALTLPFAALGWILLGSLGRGVDALTLGEETAASLGINVSRLRLAAIIGVALSVGSAVAAVGSVGFVGLVIPHLLRPFVGYQPSRLLLPSALGGALLVTIADIIVRLIPSEGELMLGVVTSLLGAPFFLALILKLEKEQR